MADSFQNMAFGKSGAIRDLYYSRFPEFYLFKAMLGIKGISDYPVVFEYCYKAILDYGNQMDYL